VTLLTNATSAGARVEGSRTDAIRHTALPAIGVYTESDVVDGDSESTAPREESHELELKVAGWVVDSTANPVDDAMDDLAEQIEAVIASDRFLGGAVGGNGLRLQRTDLTILADGNADPLVGRVTLTYAATYFHVPGVATPTDDYLRTGVTTKIAGAGDDNTVSDLFDQR
jgi:hypothetical protein